MEEILYLLVFWIISWVWITFMDRIDEHNLIKHKYKSVLAYIFWIIWAIWFIFAMQINSILLPFIFVLCLEWILKNKLEFPSHIFMLFLITLYLWYKIELLLEMKNYIIWLWILILFFEILKHNLDKTGIIYKVIFKSYLSKIFIDLWYFIFAWNVFLIIYWLSFAYSCLFVKKYFPGEN